MKAIFIVPIENANMVLPPLQSKDGIQLQYTVDGVLHGGYAAIGGIPQTDMALCLLDTTPETVDAMIADGRWTFVEEVVDGEAED